jgi:hypothetical protein
LQTPFHCKRDVEGFRQKTLLKYKPKENNPTLHSTPHTHLPTRHHNPSSPTVFFLSSLFYFKERESPPSSKVAPVSSLQKPEEEVCVQSPRRTSKAKNIENAVYQAAAFTNFFLSCFQGAATIQLQKPTLFQTFIVLRKMKKKKPKKKKNQTLPNLQKISP